MNVPFLNLAAQYSDLKPFIIPALEKVLENCRFTLGPEVEAFEWDFADFCGVDAAVAVNTGTSALHLALLAAGVGQGDEVITVPITFVATVAAIAYTGARPVLVDVLPDRMTIDPERVKAAITPRTKAIVPVHLYGQVADMASILDIARAQGLVVIEDACQAHGATYHGKQAGSLADMGCFSFYPGKNLGAYGEGGAVTTNDHRYASAIRMLRDWGAKKRYHHEMLGFNYRMEEFQGAILKIKLAHLMRWNSTRRALAAIYDRTLTGTPLKLPPAVVNDVHAYHIYAVRTEDPSSLQDFLQNRNIQTGRHYPIPVHLQAGYQFLGYKQGDFPVAEAVAAQELSLPICPYMVSEQAAYVCGTILEYFGAQQ